MDGIANTIYLLFGCIHIEGKGQHFFLGLFTFGEVSQTMAEKTERFLQVYGKWVVDAGFDAFESEIVEKFGTPFCSDRVKRETFGHLSQSRW